VAAEQVAARGGHVHAADDIHQRGFSGARRAHDGHELGFVDGQRNVLQGRDGDVAHAVYLGDMLELNQRTHARFRSA